MSSSELDKMFSEYLSRRREIRGGRCVSDGYERAISLQFGKLREVIRKDPAYIRAAQTAGVRGIVSEDNRMNVFLLIRYFLPRLQFGHVIEFGSYRGGTAIFMAAALAEVVPDAKVFALDSYEGMPETNASIDRHREGDFGDVDIGEIRAFAASRDLRNIEFVKGMFDQTTVSTLDRAGTISLAHIDCDVYDSVAYSFKTVKPYMVKGGYYVFDDALYSSCLGAMEAIEELVIRQEGLSSEQAFPQFVFRADL